MSDLSGKNSDVREWIIKILREECGVACLDLEQTVFSQIDSFQVVNFLMLCDDRFHALEGQDMSALPQLNVEGFVRLLTESSS